MEDEERDEIPPQVGEDPNDEILKDMGKAPARVKPDISDLRPVVDGDRFLPVVGDNVVLEISVGSDWLSTRQYRIVSINGETGDLVLFNDDLGQHAAANWQSLDRYGMEMRFAPPRGIPIGAKRRGRPRKPDSAPPKAAAPILPGQRRRGRPPKAAKAIP